MADREGELVSEFAFFMRACVLSKGERGLKPRGF
jgi:hypothetical protein